MTGKNGDGLDAIRKMLTTEQGRRVARAFAKMTPEEQEKIVLYIEALAAAESKGTLQMEPEGKQ